MERTNVAGKAGSLELYLSEIGRYPPLTPAEEQRLAAATAADPQRLRVTVDLFRQRVAGPTGLEFGFELDPESREMLLEGLDAIDLTLKQRPAIAAFRERDRRERPWIYLDKA